MNDAIKKENAELKEYLDQVESNMMEILYEAIMDVFYSSTDAIFLIKDHTFVANNAIAQELFAFSNESEIKNSNFEILSAPIQSENIPAKDRINELYSELEENGSCHFEWICQKQTGKTFHATITFTNIQLKGSEHLYVAIRDITKRKAAEKKIREMNTRLIELSRQAGMSEVATGVLHNIGNILNSVNISSETTIEKVKSIHSNNFIKTIELIKNEFPEFDNFLEKNERGQMIKKYLSALSETTDQKKEGLLTELKSIKANVDAIKNIVSLQQSLASKGGMIETVSVTDVIDNALQINRGSLERHRINIIKNYDQKKVFLVENDRLKILQIIINLISNAIHACADYNEDQNCITITIFEKIDHTDVIIDDNGIGISPENIKQIFEYGFTTKKDGHGFGLHNSANAAKEMGGQIKVESEGSGKGATFIFSIPSQIRQE